METEIQEIQKIKYICRLHDGKYVENKNGDISQEFAEYAEMLLHCFFPEKLVRQLSLETSTEKAVLVFRTNTQQVREFQELLQAHEISG
ncbi:MAG TPA: hypothetical protein DCO72_09220 [Ruminococcus sp.]|nr:hypothetical protein [Ruminococcus sp.]